MTIDRDQQQQQIPRERFGTEPHMEIHHEPQEKTQQQQPLLLARSGQRPANGAVKCEYGHDGQRPAQYVQQREQQVRRIDSSGIQQPSESVGDHRLQSGAHHQDVFPRQFGRNGRSEKLHVRVFENLEMLVRMIDLVAEKREQKRKQTPRQNDVFRCDSPEKRSHIL